MGARLSLVFILLPLFVTTRALAAEPPLRVVTTTNMIADLVTNVGGNRVVVTSLMGPGVDPHLYKATQGDLEQLTGADVIFYNGLHLEGKMTEVFEKLRERRPIFAVTDDIDRKLLRTPEEFAGNFDPHIWFDVRLWISAVTTVERLLGEQRPRDRENFQANAARYREQLQKLDQWVGAELRKVSKPQRVLITAHDAFGYFGRAYDIEVMGLQGVSTASEYGLHDLQRLSDLIVARKVKAIFVESSVPEKFILSLQRGVQARGHDVKIGGQLFSDAMDAPDKPGGTYIGMVTENVKTIVSALQ